MSPLTRSRHLHWMPTDSLSLWFILSTLTEIKVEQCLKLVDQIEISRKKPHNIIQYSSRSRGRGSHAPRSCKKINHKKDGCRRRLHTFHVSCRPPLPNNNTIKLTIQLTIQLIAKLKSISPKLPAVWVNASNWPDQINCEGSSLMQCLYWTGYDKRIARGPVLL